MSKSQLKGYKSLELLVWRLTVTCNCCNGKNKYLKFWTETPEAVDESAPVGLQISSLLESTPKSDNAETSFEWGSGSIYSFLVKSVLKSQVVWKIYTHGLENKNNFSVNQMMKMLIH